MAQRRSPLAVLAAAALAAAACSAPVRQYRCADVPSAGAAAADPRTIWSCNVEVMQRIVKGGEFSLREFWGAADFLQNLTGISADVIETPHGRVPGPKIASSLRGWTDWYAAHASELKWDATTGTVRLVGADEG